MTAIFDLQEKQKAFVSTKAMYTSRKSPFLNTPQSCSNTRGKYMLDGWSKNPDIATRHNMVVINGVANPGLSNPGSYQTEVIICGQSVPIDMDKMCEAVLLWG